MCVSDQNDVYFLIEIYLFFVIDSEGVILRDCYRENCDCATITSSDPNWWYSFFALKLNFS